VGAPQKRFAWAIGFVLALTMLYLVVINNIIGTINLIVCAACLVLLFSEAAFGICIGCTVYNLFDKDGSQLCPGGVCEAATRSGSRGTLAQAVIVTGFVTLVGVVALWVAGNEPHAAALQATAVRSEQTPIDPAEAERCKDRSSRKLWATRTNGSCTTIAVELARATDHEIALGELIFINEVARRSA
jgi:Domain of unknown function (DUF4395)